MTHACYCRWAFIQHGLAAGVVLGTFVLSNPSSAQENVLFEDQFQGGLADGWEWLRENPAHWCVRKGALEIRVPAEPKETVTNALVRAAPDRGRGTYAIEVTVTNLTQPTQQYEQAGITWYHDGKPVFKLVKELVDGRTTIVPGGTPLESPTVQLRLIVTADSYVAQYRPDAKGKFQTAATGKLPAPGDDKVSLQCYYGPPDAEHWFRFDDFQIVEVSQ